MKKTLFVCIALCTALSLWAQEAPTEEIPAAGETAQEAVIGEGETAVDDLPEAEGGEEAIAGGEAGAGDFLKTTDSAGTVSQPAAPTANTNAGTAQIPHTQMIEELPEEEEPFRMKNRTFELGLANLRFNMANDFMGVSEVFQDTVVIDLDGFKKGFKIDFGVNLAPFFINVNIKDNWGVGLDVAHIEAFGNLDISENLLSLQKATDDKFGVGAAVFADVGIPAFFHIKKFKINVRPAVFVPLMYAEPDITYNFREINEGGKRGTLLELDYDMRVYTPISLGTDTAFSEEVDLNTFNGGVLGYDLSAGVEYPLFSWLDLGADFKNIPLIPSKLRYYMQLTDRMFLDTSNLNYGALFGDSDEEVAIEDEDYHIPGEDDFKPQFGKETGDKTILRPFKMVTYAKYRPFKTPLLSLIGFLGFAINPLYVQPASIEGGIKVRSDLANIFIPTLSISYEDRLWKNGIDFVLNGRAFELDLGVSMQSQDFLKSWQAAGIGVNVGMKFGW